MKTNTNTTNDGVGTSGENTRPTQRLDEALHEYRRALAGLIGDEVHAARFASPAIHAAAVAKLEAVVNTPVALDDLTGAIRHEEARRGLERLERFSTTITK